MSKIISLKPKSFPLSYQGLIQMERIQVKYSTVVITRRELSSPLRWELTRTGRTKRCLSWLYTICREKQLDGAYFHPQTLFDFDHKWYLGLEPVISMSPEQISVIPNLSEIKHISLLPIQPIFWILYWPKFNFRQIWNNRNLFRTHWYNWLYAKSK